MPGTVYIMGAGASRAETLQEKLPTPLVNNFFSEKYIYEYWYDLDFGSSFKESALYFVLSRYFSSEQTGGRRPINLENINIEEVYSFLYSFERVFQGKSDRREYFYEAKRQLHKYLITVIRYTSWQKKASPFLEWLIKSLNKNDSIITFNWDTLIDQSLKKINTKISRDLLQSTIDCASPARNPVPASGPDRIKKLHTGAFLKVHGAINLTHCANPACYRHENPYIWNPEEETPALWQCQECGNSTSEMILSPHGAKTYTSGRFFRQQANLAAEKLSIAEHIVIVGYSFPTFDIEARSMLRCSRLDDDHGGAWLSRVSLIDPKVKKKAYVKIIANLLGTDNFQAHGHEVKLNLYESVDDYMNAIKYKAEPKH